ncbi:hypothetical protein PoB_004907700 [Plakobranchus ocellatus]|uniref:Uncharacterized protein n=1 Tax=Plakobranchus ocellatus TaxID=259542 RepID=A0AAV4BTA8_9GAST|nr:hypothetical protein PoB_004907700 [Plakobranchus ocellatus]
MKHYCVETSAILISGQGQKVKATLLSAVITCREKSEPRRPLRMSLVDVRPMTVPSHETLSQDRKLPLERRTHAQYPVIFRAGNNKQWRDVGWAAMIINFSPCFPIRVSGLQKSGWVLCEHGGEDETHGTGLGFDPATLRTMDEQSTDCAIILNSEHLHN